MSVQVISWRCPKNHKCPAVSVCPVDAISQKGYDAPVIDEEKCIDCGKCNNYCPTGAIKAK